MLTDTAKTELLRDYLIDAHVAGVRSYVWFDGEALYLGNPFTPTSSEAKAIARVKSWDMTADYDNNRYSGYHYQRSLTGLKNAKMQPHEPVILSQLSCLNSKCSNDGKWSVPLNGKLFCQVCGAKYA